eukprot:747872-Hanusia_phi.AAC.1
MYGQSVSNQERAGTQPAVAYGFCWIRRSRPNLLRNSESPAAAGRPAGPGGGLDTLGYLVIRLDCY